MKVARPPVDETVWLAVVFVADTPATLVSADEPEPEPEPEPDPEPEPVCTAAAVVEAGTRAATLVAPDALIVEKATWGTVRMVETVTVVDEPTMVTPWLAPAVCVAAWTMVVA